MVNVRIVDHDQTKLLDFTTRRRTALVCTWTNHFNFINSGKHRRNCLGKSLKASTFTFQFIIANGPKKGRTNSGALEKPTSVLEASRSHRPLSSGSAGYSLLPIPATLKFAL